MIVCFCSFGQTNIISTNAPIDIAPFRYLHALRVTHAAPTNFFNARETVLEGAPTISSENIFSSHSKYTIGYALEVEHWTTSYAGTGFEIGTYDTRNAIDHFTIFENFRYVPFNGPFWNRFAVGWKMGAETSLISNSKAVEFGAEFYWHFSENVRFEADILQHQRTSPEQSGQTARVALQFLF